MAINYITKVGKEKVQAMLIETFKRGALSDQSVNQDYNFDGAKGIKLTNVATVALKDYNRGTGYGDADSLSTTQTEYLMTQDKYFSIVIDKMDLDESGYALEATKVLKRQLDKEVIPVVDKYRFNKMATATGIGSSAVTLTKANVIDELYKITEWFDENEIPMTERVINITSKAVTLIKTSDSFVSNRDLGTPITISGQIGELDGMAVVKVPSNRFPAKVNMIACHKSACVAPIKLEDTMIHPTSERYSGALLNGRFVYDAFVIKELSKAVYVQKDA